MTRLSVALFAVPLVFLMLATTSGCKKVEDFRDELDARRKIQKAGKMYSEGRFAQAADLYEQALEKAPFLVIGHHNAGLTYSKLFKPGDESPENIAMANKCAEHFMVYLETNPENTNIISLITRIWMDSGQYTQALDFWKGQLAKDPGNANVLEVLAGINRQAGKWEKAVEWYYKQVEATDGVSNKVDTLLLIAKLIWHKLYRQQPVAYERLKVADVGLAALQKAMALKPPEELRMKLHAYLSSLYQFRALAHYASWARELNRASMRYHSHERKVLNDALQEQKKEEEKKNAADQKDPKTGLLESRLPAATGSG